MRERDVGLFSLVQQVLANAAWAEHEGRVPIADFRERCCYWTPGGHRGESSSVWEYYFEPVVPEFPAEVVPSRIRAAIDARFPDQYDLGYWLGDALFVTNHYGDHPSLADKAPAIPFMTANPTSELRLWTSELIARFIRPRAYLEAAVSAFFDEHMSEREVIGVHVRGTDAVSSRETRAYRQGSLDLERFTGELSAILETRPRAHILVATDEQASLDRLVEAFGDRVMWLDTLRHVDGEGAGSGPTGRIMPAYITQDRDAAARNGEDAVVEYLLLSRCVHLVHNGAGLALTALLRNPDLAHTNTHNLERKV